MVECREQRSGRGDVRREGVIGKSIGKPQRPGVSADIEHRRDARADIRPRVALWVCLQLRDRLLIRVPGAEVERVGTPVGPAGLREVHVCVDESGGDPHPFHVQHVDAERQRTLRRATDAVDLAVAEHDVRARHRRPTAAVDERRAGECPRRRRRPDGRINRSGQGNPPSVGRLHEEPLGDAAVLVRAVANPVTIRAIDPARLKLRQVDVVGLDQVRPLGPGPLREVLETGGETGRAAAHKQRGVKVVREVFVAVPLADGVDVPVEHSARGSKVVVGSLSQDRRRSGEQSKREQSSHEFPPVSRVYADGGSTKEGKQYGDSLDGRLRRICRALNGHR